MTFSKDLGQIASRDSTFRYLSVSKRFFIFCIEIYFQIVYLLIYYYFFSFLFLEKLAYDNFEIKCSYEFLFYVIVMVCSCALLGN